MTPLAPPLDQVVREWVAVSDSGRDAQERMLAAAGQQLAAARECNARVLERVCVLICCADDAQIPRAQIAALLGVDRSTVHRVLRRR